MIDLSANLKFALLLASVGPWTGLYAADAAGQQPAGTAAGHMSMAEHMATMEPSPMASIDEQGIVADFELIDRDGNTITDEDFRGRYVLLGFGYTHCEHICPLMAFNMGRVTSQASMPVTGIFVSVDTERDTPAVSDDYARHFGESMLGLGGSVEQINAAVKNFKVSYAVTKTQDAYTVQHTANVFLIDPAGEVADVFSFSTTPEKVLEAIH